jgi:hypothetical protein
MHPILEELSVAVALVAALLGALELGFRCGRRAHQGKDALTGGQVGAIQGALLGLLGLLLAFSFAAAGARFLERQDLIVVEANAIGTAYLRADLLDEPHRSDLRAALKRYTEHRIDATSRLGTPKWDPSVLDEVDALHERIWSAALAGVEDRPHTLVGVLPPVNEVIDVHSLRIAAGRKHIPLIVMGLLIVCSTLSVAVIGYGCGMGGARRAPLTVPLALIIGAALWITIDLDHPRAGLLQLSDQPLQMLKLDPR